MYGAILGDIVGSPYERYPIKTKDFPMFIPRSRFTDDTVMTVAVAEALLDTEGQDPEARRSAVIRSMQDWGLRYPRAGYGGSFSGWLTETHPRPYNSWGNGSAMRVSSVGWLCDTLDGVLRTAKLTAEVTHSHPEGIRGAQCTAAVICLARAGKSKEEIRAFVTEAFGYDLSRTCGEIRPDYRFDVSCQGTVPPAVTAFLEGGSFEDVIRTAVSLGGDCDTLTCIAGGMAEAMYGVPEKLKEECRSRLTPDMLQVLDRFERRIGNGA